MEQVPKNSKFRKTRSRLGQENPKKEVEPIAPTRKLSHKQNILQSIYLKEYQYKYSSTSTHSSIRAIYTINTYVCVFSSHPFWTSSSLDVPAGVTQDF